MKKLQLCRYYTDLKIFFSTWSWAHSCLYLLSLWIEKGEFLLLFFFGNSFFSLIILFIDIKLVFAMISMSIFECFEHFTDQGMWFSALHSRHLGWLYTETVCVLAFRLAPAIFCSILFYNLFVNTPRFQRNLSDTSRFDFEF